NDVSPKVFNRIDRARAHGAALPGRNRAERGSRPRGCTDLDTASGRPIGPSSNGQFGAPIELMPNGCRLAAKLVSAAVTRSSISRNQWGGEGGIWDGADMRGV